MAHCTTALFAKILIINQFCGVPSSSIFCKSEKCRTMVKSGLDKHELILLIGKVEIYTPFAESDHVQNELLPESIMLFPYSCFKCNSFYSCFKCNSFPEPRGTENMQRCKVRKCRETIDEMNQIATNQLVYTIHRFEELDGHSNLCTSSNSSGGKIRGKICWPCSFRQISLYSLILLERLLCCLKCDVERLHGDRTERRSRR